MDNLRSAIKVIFGHSAIDYALSNWYDRRRLGLCGNFPEKLFIENSQASFDHYSLDEIKNVHRKLMEDWFIDPATPLRKNNSVFNLLHHFNDIILSENKSEPFVRYEHLLKWRELSLSLGEDLFTTSFFAYSDVRSGRKRNYFSWRPVAYTDNKRLKSILDKGVAENHFHLKGSAPVFDITWISLMNNCYLRNLEFADFKKGTKLTSEVNDSFSSRKTDIEVLVYKAAYIRLALFKVILGEEPLIKEDFLKHGSNNEDSFALLINLSCIQDDVSAYKELYGYRFNHRDNEVVADYAILKNSHEYNFEGSVLLSGERKLLYQCFSKVYANDADFEHYHELFYVYLLIKNTLRNELIQINSRVGFGNFLAYQDRKELFIKKGTIYAAAFLTMAVTDTLKFQNITHFETRIVPKSSTLELNKSLYEIQRVLSSDQLVGAGHQAKVDQFLRKSQQEEMAQASYFHTLHFIKKKDQADTSDSHRESMLTPRHASLRQEVKKQAQAIVGLRESLAPNAALIRGIDAASSEFAARPEVFAQAFRYLKEHELSGRYNIFRERLDEKRLAATYHAGEDFFDIVDGLRTIDEAVSFLNLGQGDRLGHALALGINPSHFFRFKKGKIILPKQILLDNVVWLLGKIREFGITRYTDEVSRLENHYESLFREIYSRNMDSGKYADKLFPHEVYYDAWKIRGDDPYLYLEHWNSNLGMIPNYTYWERCRINHSFPKEGYIRRSDDIKYLFHEYHFNPKVKAVGATIRQFSISDSYISLIAEIQRHYQNIIAGMNIGIECNPTSNYLIGTFKRYANHPISRFNNLGLETDPVLIGNCPQLFVSINTDDQGIFSTSLENEYALMAIAMEKEKNDDGKLRYTPTMIYAWLDNIRQMGIEQSFQ